MSKTAKKDDLDFIIPSLRTEKYGDGPTEYYVLIDEVTGEKLWSEAPEECKAKGFPVQTSSQEAEIAELKAIAKSNHEKSSHWYAEYNKAFAEKEELNAENEKLRQEVTAYRSLGSFDGVKKAGEKDKFIDLAVTALLDSNYENMTLALQFYYLHLQP